MADTQYDRSTQDLGNIVNLGHINVCITDQHLATHYYVTGLGLTRDPFLNTSARLMWINVGTGPVHLPLGQARGGGGGPGCGGPGSPRAARPSGAGAQAAGGDQVRFPREQRLRRDRLPL